MTQEVMAQVARSASQFDYAPERGRFRDWLGVVTRSKVVDHGRAAGRSARTGGGAGGDPDGVAAAGADPDWGEEFDA